MLCAVFADSSKRAICNVLENVDVFELLDLSVIVTPTIALPPVAEVADVLLVTFTETLYNVVSIPADITETKFATVVELVIV